VLSPSQNPPILPPWAKGLDELGGRWWVAHTKARNEKALAWDLLRRDIGYFLPLRHCVTYSGGRKRRVLKPLFTSYLFLCGDDRDRYTAMTTNRICRTLDVFDQDELVTQLIAIEKALVSDAELIPCSLPEIGRRCRVRAGPLVNVEGVVVEHGKRARLILAVSILGQGASLEIDADLLEPLG